MKIASTWLIVCLVFGALGWRGFEYLGRVLPDCGAHHCQPGSNRP